MLQQFLKVQILVRCKFFRKNLKTQNESPTKNNGVPASCCFLHPSPLDQTRISLRHLNIFNQIQILT